MPSLAPPVVALRAVLDRPGHMRVCGPMQMLRHTKTLGIIQIDESVWEQLTKVEVIEIERICDEKLESYYSRLK